MIMKWRQNITTKPVCYNELETTGDNWRQRCLRVNLLYLFGNLATGDTGDISLVNIYRSLSLSLSLFFSLSLSAKVSPVSPVGLFLKSHRRLNRRQTQNRVSPVVSSSPKHKKIECFSIEKRGENDLV